MPRTKDYKEILGNKYGKLTVLKILPREQNIPMALCLCECGKKRAFNIYNLTRSKKGIESCGCEKGKGQITHGMSHTRIYKTWTGMMSRCYNKKRHNYDRYGGRGITVAKRWHTFENFYADVGNPPSPKHSLDRINNSLGYKPGNVRWLLPQQQSWNMRSNKNLTLNGVTKCVSEWSDFLGFKKGVIPTRLANGWSVEDALTTPVKFYRPRSTS